MEPEIFLSCISTIIRQVDGMRKMVNEFSAFARMPVPVFSKINLTNLVKEIASLSVLSNEIEEIIVKGEYREKSISGEDSSIVVIQSEKILL